MKRAKALSVSEEKRVFFCQLTYVSNKFLDETGVYLQRNGESHIGEHSRVSY